MKISKLTLMVGLALAATSAHASGPLYLSMDTGTLKPLAWDTSKGPIPVYTDGGGAFTYNFDKVTPFITLDRANEITAFAFNEWSKVPTSTFRAEIAGTIASKTGIADVTHLNVGQMYGVENGYGFWVLYDTDGMILEKYFGVPKNSVLGIAFPEFDDGQGNIIEATALMNGWAVHVSDTQGKQIAAVFTHEFGHAINLSHSQVNGPMVLSSLIEAPYYPGVKGCVAPVHRWDYSATAGANRANPATLETMYPFLNHAKTVGIDQSTVDMPDDIAGISNLYPTASYKATRGSISGVLRLKDGRNEYSGINVIARNVDNPLFDAVSNMTGSATQGELGPDGTFTINNLTPGQNYVVYIEPIVAGGYPTTPQALVSQGEYWNVAEGSDPTTDTQCDATPILAEAGVTKQADIAYNGYAKGVQFKPLPGVVIQQISKSGSSAIGIAGSTPVKWDEKTGYSLLPPGFTTQNSTMDRNGNRVLVTGDRNGNGIREPVILEGNVPLWLGDLNGDTCGGTSTFGTLSAVPFAMDDAAAKAVGMAYIDRNGDGKCIKQGANEIVPFVWDAKRGMRELRTQFATAPGFVRASGISGNGRVIVGTATLQQAVAWVDEGNMINLGQLVGARDLYTSNYDGTRVPMYSFAQKSMLLWNAMRGTGAEAFTNIGGLRYCIDVPYVSFSTGADMCAAPGAAETMFQQYGYAPLNVTGSNDKGDVMIGRAGGAQTGFAGAIWIEGIGWMRMREFLRKQGVVEADAIPFDGTGTVSASGKEWVGGVNGNANTWMVRAEQVYVCENGQSVLTGFPGGLRDKVAAGAKLGRCEFQ